MSDEDQKKRPQIIDARNAKSQDEFNKQFETPGLASEDAIAEELEDSGMMEKLTAEEVPEYEGDPERLEKLRTKLKEGSGDLAAATAALEELGKIDPAEMEEADAGPEGEPGEPIDLDAEGDRLIPVKIDGEIEHVPVSEAAAGYQRHSVFTRKTMRLAEQRNELESALEVEKKRLAQLDHAYGDSLTPQARATLDNAWQEIQARQEAARAHRLKHEVLPREAEQLREKLGWESDSDIQEGRDLIAKHATQSYGFEPSDLEGLTDHRLIMLAHDASKWRELKNQTDEAVEAGRKKSKSRNLEPGTSNARRSSENPGKKAAAARLKRTGRLRDAQEALSYLFK